MPTLGTLFSGGRFADIGFHQAGYTSVFAVEYDAKIAAAANINFDTKTTVASVCDVDYAALPRANHIHASPVCTNASLANTDATESDVDIATAMATCRAIEAQQPDTFSLENVWGYRTFQAFDRIVTCLKDNGYEMDYWHLNSADYGVPQARKRLILLARKNGRVFKPLATHTNKGDDTQLTMFDPLLPWIGWYEAIEDLLPSLPNSEFAPWQLERLPEYLRTSIIVDGQANTHATCVTVRNGNAPMYTITASSKKRPARAFLIRDDNAGQAWGKQYRDAEDPAYSQSLSSGGKAFLVPGGNATSFGIRYDDEPARTVGDVNRIGNTPRAWLVPGGNQYTPILPQDQPAFTMTSSSASSGHRAWLQQGRVVKMTPRALARFQSIPDWYVLPENNRLACKMIGNGVPCELTYHAALALKGG